MGSGGRSMLSTLTTKAIWVFALAATPLIPQSARRIKEVMPVLELLPGYVVADIGCGSAWLATAVADVVGENGRVYAVELRESTVEGLSRCERSRVSVSLPSHGRINSVPRPMPRGARWVGNERQS